MWTIAIKITAGIKISIESSISTSLNVSVHPEAICISKIDIAVSESPSKILLIMSHAIKPSPFPLKIQRFKAQRKTEKT